MKRLTIFLFFAALFLPGALAQSDEIPRRKRHPSPIDSKIFLGDWWDYYNRAIHRIIEGDLSGAESDLREALKYRPDDARRARTYGVRFQEYYPHAELGAILFDNGRYEEALRELKIANASAPLLQNTFFIHESQRQVALAKGLDRQKPVLAITSPPAELVTNRSSLTVSGAVSDDLFVDSITVGGRPVDVSRGKSNVEFDLEIPLPRDVNRVLVRAEDLVGREVVQELVIHVDRQGPTLSLEKTELVSGNRARLVGMVYDRNDVGKITVDGAPVAAPPGPRGRIDVEVPLQPGRETFRLAMADGFGNETVVDLNPRLRTGSIAPRRKAVRVAALGFDPRWLVAAPSEGPEIDLLGFDEVTRVFQEEFLVDVHVRDSKGVAEVHLDRNPLDLIQGVNIFTSGAVGPLTRGPNEVNVRALNNEGDSSSQSVEIEYEPPMEIPEQAKLAVAIPDFEVYGNATGDEARRVFQRAFENEVFDRRRFKITTVDPEIKNALLQEHLINNSDASDNRYKGGGASLIAADLFLDGQFEERPRSVTARLSVVWVDTGAPARRLLEVSSINKDRGGILDLARRLAIKLHQEFPLAKGEVIRVDPNILTTLSEQHRIASGDKILAFRQGDPIIHNDKHYGASTEFLGVLTVSRILDEYSELLPAVPEAEMVLQVEDLVSAR